MIRLHKDKKKLVLEYYGEYYDTDSPAHWLDQRLEHIIQKFGGKSK